MGKAAAAAAGSAVAGLAAFLGLASLLPLAWAEGSALLLTGGGLFAASFVLARRSAPRTEAPGPVQRPQEA